MFLAKRHFVSRFAAVAALWLGCDDIVHATLDYTTIETGIGTVDTIQQMSAKWAPGNQRTLYNGTGAVWIVGSGAQTLLAYSTGQNDIPSHEETYISGFGKIKKIVNIISQIKAGQSFWDVSSCATSLVDKLESSSVNKVDWPITALLGQMRNNSNQIQGLLGAPSDISASITYFSCLNTIIEELHKARIKTGETTFDGTADDDAATLFALTQIGSRGYSPTLAGAIAGITATGPTTATTVLKGTACWRTIWGTESDTASHSGSMISQLLAAGVGSTTGVGGKSLLENFKEIAASFEIGKFNGNVKMSDFYKYIIPTTPADYILLDRLSTDSSNESSRSKIIEARLNTLSIQECLLFILSEETAPSGTQIMSNSIAIGKTDTVLNHLTNRIKTCCEAMLGKFKVVCCDNVYKSLRQLGDDLYANTQFLQTFALDPFTAIRATDAIVSKQTELSNAISAFNSIKEVDAQNCDDSEIVSKVDALDTIIKAINNAFFSTISKNEVLTSPLNAALTVPVLSYEYCVSVHTIITQHVPQYLDMLYSAINNINTWINDIDITASAADVIHDGLGTLRTFLQALHGVFPGSAIVFKSFCKTEYADASGDLEVPPVGPLIPQCRHITNSSDEILSINTKIPQIMESLTTGIGYIDALQTKLLHIIEQQRLATSLRILDESVFHLSQLIGQVDPSTLVYNSLSVTDVTQCIYNIVHQVIIPPASAFDYPSAILELATALNTLLGNPLSGSYTEPLSFDVDGCEPCTTINSVLRNGIPVYLTQILQSICSINDYIRTTPPEVIAFDTERRRESLAELQAFLTDIQPLFDLSITASAFCEEEAQCLNFSVAPINASILAIKNAMSLGIQDITFVTPFVDHLAECSANDDVHIEILGHVHAIAECWNIIFTDENTMALFDTWDGEQNVMVGVIGKLTSALSAYPLTLPEHSGHIYDIDSSSFSAFVGLLVEAQGSLSVLAGNYALPDTWHAPSNTADLWRAIVDELSQISVNISSWGVRIASIRDCVIPVVGEAFLGLNVALNDVLACFGTEEDGQITINRSICIHHNVPPATWPLNQLTSLAALFGDPDPCGDPMHDCGSAATNLVAIYNALSTDVTPAYVYSKFDEIMACLDGMITTHNLGKLASDVLYELTGELNAPSLSATELRYGYAACMVNALDKIVRMIPCIHNQLQHIIMTKDADLFRIESFNTLIEKVRAVLAILEVRPCPTASIVEWRFPRIEKKWEDFLEALLLLKDDILLNAFVNDELAPVAGLLSSINGRIIVMATNAVQLDGLTALFHAIASRQLADTTVEQELTFWNTQLETYVSDAGAVFEPIPAYTTDVRSLVELLNGFVCRMVGSIFTYARQLTASPASVDNEHYRADLIQHLNTVINVLPHCKAMLHKLIDRFKLLNALHAEGAIDELHYNLQQYMDALLVPPTCIASVNNAVYSIQRVIGAFIDGNPVAFPAISVFPGAPEGCTVMDSLLQMSSNIEEQDAPTLLPATIQRTLEMFAKLPEVIFDLRLTFGDAPDWLEDLKQFQFDAFRLLRNMRTSDVAALFCGYALYDDAIKVIEMYPLEQLHLTINAAISDYEKAIHKCALLDNVRQTAQAASTLHQKLALLPLAEILEPPTTLDSILVQVEQCIAAELTLEYAQQPDDIFSYSDVILKILNEFFFPTFSDTAYEAAPSLQQILDDAAAYILNIAKWFRSLANHSDWSTVKYHLQLSSQLRTLAQLLQGPIASIPDGALCNRCKVDVGAFFNGYVPMIGDIRESCLVIAERCAVCNACKPLVAAASGLAALVESLEAYSADFPQYDKINSVMSIMSELSALPETQMNLSCENSVGFITTLCSKIEAMCAALDLTPKVPDLVTGEHYDCSILEAMCVRMLSSVTKIADKMTDVLYNAQAPPHGNWVAMAELLQGTSTLVSAIKTVFYNIQYCGLCNSVAFSYIFADIETQMDRLVDYVSQLNEQWNTYADYNDNKQILTKLFNFFELQNTIDGYINSAASVSEMCSRVESWGQFLREFESLEKIKEEYDFFTLLPYEWLSPQFLHSTRTFLANYINEITYVATKNIHTLRFVHDYLNTNVTNISQETFALVRGIKNVKSNWVRFIAAISLPQIVTPNSILLTLPTSFMQALEEVLAIFDEIVRDLSEKPSICKDRAFHLFDINQVVRAICDKTSIADICSNDTTDRVTGIGALLTAIADATAADPAHPELPFDADCSGVEVSLSNIVYGLELIDGNVRHASKETDWSSLSPDNIPDYQAFGSALHEMLAAFPLNVHMCDLCNVTANEIYIARCRELVRSITINIVYICDQLSKPSYTSDARELAVVSEFCERMAAFFESKIEDPGTRDVDAFRSLVDVLQTSSVLSWGQGDFALLEADIASIQANASINLSVVTLPRDRRLEWYHLSLLRSFNRIYASLVNAGLSLNNHLDLIHTGARFSAFAEELHSVLKQAWGQRPENSQEVSSRNVWPLLNIIAHIAEEGRRWFYVAPVQTSEALEDAWPRIERLARNLKALDNHLDGGWGAIADVPGIFDVQDENAVGVLDEVVNNIAAALVASSDIKDVATHSIAALFTRYNFHLGEIVASLQSIALKVEADYSHSISENIRNYLLSYAPLTIPAFDATNTEQVLISSETVALLALFRDATLRIIDALNGKCCAPESLYYSELADEFYKVRHFFRTLTAEQLTSDMPEVAAICAYIQSLPSAEYVEHQVQPELLLHIRALASHLCPDAIDLPKRYTRHNERRKQLELIRIQECIDGINRKLYALIIDVKQRVFTYTPDAITMLRAFQHFRGVMDRALPHALSHNDPTDLFSQPLDTLQERLDALVDALLNYRCCVEYANNILALLNAVEGAQVGIADAVHNNIEHGIAFDALFAQLVHAFESVVEHTRSFDTLFDIVGDLQGIVPVGYTRAYSIPQCEAWPFALHKSAEAVQNMSMIFDEVLTYWGNTPPAYSQALYENIVKLQGFILNVRNNLLQTLDQPPAHFAVCRTCVAPIARLKTDLCSRIHAQTLATLASVLFQRQYAEVRHRQFRIAEALQALENAVASCVELPLMAVNIDAVSYNITNTTVANNWFCALLANLRTVSQEYCNESFDDNTFIASIHAFSSNLLQEYINIGGTALPAPIPLVEQYATPDSVIFERLVEYVTNTCNRVYLLFKSYFEQPYSGNSTVRDAVIITARFCQDTAALLATPSFAGHYSLPKDVHFKFAAQLQLLAKHLNEALADYSPKCCENNRASLVQRTFAQFAEEVALLTDALVTQSAQDGDAFTCSANITSLSTSLGSFITQLESVVTHLGVAPAPEVLCYDASAQIMQIVPKLNLVVGAAHDISSTVDASILPAQLPPAWGADMGPTEENLVALARVLSALRDGPRSLNQSLVRLREYFARTGEVAYQALHVPNLKNINTVLTSMVAQLQLLQANMVKACQSYQYSLIIVDIAQEISKYPPIIEEIIESIKLRFWAPYSHAIHRLRTYIRAQTHAMALLRDIGATNEALTGADKDDKYTLLRQYLTAIKGQLQTFALITIDDLESVHNEAEISHVLDQFVAFADGLGGTSTSTQLAQIGGIFGRSLPPLAPSVIPATNVFQYINDNINSILEELLAQAVSLGIAQNVNTGLGCITTQGLLTTIAAYFEASGPIARNIVNMLDLYSVLSDTFYGGERMPIHNVSAQVSNTFTDIYEKIIQLSDLFNIERCGFLFNTYSLGIHPQLQRLSSILQAIDVVAEFNWALLDEPNGDEGTSVLELIEGMTMSLYNLSEHLPAHYYYMADKLRYCSAGIVNVYVEQVYADLNRVNNLLAGQHSALQALPLTTDNSACGDTLNGARLDNLSVTNNIATFLTRLVEFVRSSGPRIPLNNIQKLISLQNALMRLCDVLRDVNGVIQEMCTFCENEAASRTFISGMEACVTIMYKNLAELSDTLAAFCCSVDVENALISIAHGVKALADYITGQSFDAAKPDALLDFVRIMNLLEAPIAAYFSAPIHSPTQDVALTGLAALLASGLGLPEVPSEEYMRIVPFNEYAKKQYVNQIIDHVVTIPRVFAQWRAILQGMTLSKNDYAVRVVSTCINRIAKFAELFEGATPANSFLHDTEGVLFVRQHIRVTLISVVEELVALRNIYLNHAAEKVVMEELDVTQNILGVLPDVLNLVLARIEQNTSDINSHTESIVARLIQLPPQSLEHLQPALARLGDAWTAATQQRPVASFDDVCGGISDINKCLYAYVTSLLNAQGQNASIAHDSTSPVGGRLTKFKDELEHFLQALNRVSVAVKNLEFDEEYVASLVNESSPILLILAAKEPIMALAQTLRGQLAYESNEWAYILESLDGMFAKLLVTITSIRDTIANQGPVRVLCTYKDVLNRVHLLSQQIDKIVGNSTIEDAEAFFRQLVTQIADAAELAPVTHAAQLDAIIALVNSAFSVTVSDAFIEPNRLDVGSIPEIQYKTEIKVERILTQCDRLTHLWLQTPYVLKPELINNVSLVLEKVKASPSSWSKVASILERFLGELRVPTFCLGRNAVLCQIEASTANMVHALNSVALNMHVLAEQKYGELLAVLSELSPNIHGINDAYKTLVHADYFDVQYINTLTQLSVIIANIQNNVNAIATIFNCVPKVAPPLTPALCEQTDLLISRIGTNVCNAQRELFSLIDSIVPEVGQVMPLRQEVITAMADTFAPIFAELCDALQYVAAHVSGMTNCVLHNSVYRRAFVTELVRQGVIMEAYPGKLERRLRQFKDSYVGSVVHELRGNVENLMILVRGLAQVDWDNSKLALVNARFEQLRANLYSDVNAWLHRTDDGQWHEFVSQLKFGDYVTILQNIYSDVGAPAPVLPNLLQTVFGERQIREDITAISQFMDTVVGVIATDIYPDFRQKRLYNPALAQVFDAVIAFSAVARVDSSDPIQQQLLECLCPAIAREGLSPIVARESLSPALSLEVLRHLEFILSHNTCCEPHTSKMSSILDTYAAIKLNLHRMSASTFGVRSQDVFLKSGPIGAMAGKLVAMVTTLGTTYAQTQNLLLQLEISSNGLCISSLDEGLTQALAHFADQMDALQAHTANMASLHCDINDLQLGEALGTEFMQFDTNIRQLNLYYDDNIATAWGNLNQALAQQHSAMLAVKAMLTHNEICFLRGDVLVAQFNEFDDFRAYIASSIRALAVYKECALARSGMHMYRIYQQLAPVVMISDILFRNATIKDALIFINKLTVSINNIAAVLEGIHDSKVYEVSYLHGLLNLEYIVCDITADLSTYIAKYGVVISATLEENLTFQSSDFALYLGQIIDTMGTSGSILLALKDWRTSIAAEDGSNHNERCYTDIFAALCAKVEVLRTIISGVNANFAPVYAQTFVFPPTEAPAPFSQPVLQALFAQLAQNLTFVKSEFTGLHTLVTNPTCCYKRLQQQALIAATFDKLRRAVLGAARNLVQDPFVCEQDLAPWILRTQEGTLALQTLASSLTSIAVDAELTCQASLISDKTGQVIIPAFQAMVLAVSNMLATIAPLAPEDAPLALPDFANICAAIISGNVQLSSIAAGMKLAMQELKVQLAQIDIFAYSQAFVDALNEFLLALRAARVQLGEFCTSFEGENCYVCNAVSYTSLLGCVMESLREFEDVIHLIEGNSSKRYSRTLHELVTAVELFGQYSHAFFTQDFDDFDPQRIEILEQALNLNARVLTQIGDSNGNYTGIKNIIHAATEEFADILYVADVALPVLMQEAPVYGASLIAQDRVRLMYVLTRFITLVEHMPTGRGHFVVRSTWQRLANVVESFVAKVRGFHTSDLSLAHELADQASELATAEQAFLEKVRQATYCEPIDAVIFAFVNFVDDLNYAFSTSSATFINNLSAQDSATFAARLDDVTTNIASLITVIADITTAPVNASPYVCSINMEHVTQLSQQLDATKGAVFNVVQVMNPYLTMPLHAEPAHYPDKVVLIRRIVEILKLLQNSMNAAWQSAANCQVRDYHKGTIDSAKLLNAKLNALVPCIPSLFNLVSVCQFCERTEIALTLSEIPAIVQQIPNDINGAILYLEQMCCSRLAFQTCNVYDKSYVISNAMNALAGESLGGIVEFLCNEDIQANSSALIELLTSNLPDKNFNLTQWVKLAPLFAVPGNDHCSAREIEYFLDQWDNVLVQIIAMFPTQYTTGPNSPLERPLVYTCDILPNVVNLCMDSVSSLSAALGILINKVEYHVFVYPKVLNLCRLLAEFVGALNSLSSINLAQTTDVFCTKCQSESVFINALRKKNASDVLVFDELRMHVETLIKILSDYCDNEAVQAFDYFRFNISLLNNILINLSRELVPFWNSNLVDDSKYYEILNINDLYSRMSSTDYGLNELLRLIVANAPTASTTYCQVGNIAHLATSFAHKFAEVVALFAEFTKDFRYAEQKNEYQELAPSNDKLALARVLSDVKTEIANVFSSLEQISTQINSNQLTTNIKIASGVLELSNNLNVQMSHFEALYHAWGNFPCPKWNDCKACEMQLSFCDNCDKVPPPGCLCNFINGTPVRKQIWDIRSKIKMMADFLDRLSQVISPNCCVEPFKPLFQLPDSMLIVQCNVLDFFRWADILNSPNYLVEFVECLSTNISFVGEALHAILQKREETRDNPNNCRMKLFSDELVLLRDNTLKLVNGTTEIIELHQIPQSFRQRWDDLKPTCTEIPSMLPIFGKCVIQITAYFDKFTELVRTAEEIDAHKEALINKLALDPLQVLYQQLIEIEGFVSSLVLVGDQRQICANCNRDVMNENFTLLKENLHLWADAVLNLKNAFVSKYCCEGTDESFANVEYITNIIKLNVDQLATYRFSVYEIYYDIYADEIKGVEGAIDVVREYLVKYLSIRQSLPKSTAVDFCFMAHIGPTFVDLGNILQGNVLGAISALFNRLGVTFISPDPGITFIHGTCSSFGIRLESVASAFDAIATNMLSIFSELSDVALHRSPAHTTEGYSAVQGVVRALADMSVVMFGIYTNAEHKKICENCNHANVLSHIYNGQATLARVVGSIHAYLVNHRHISLAVALNRFLDAYGKLTSTFDSLHLVGDINRYINDANTGHAGQLLSIVYGWIRSLTKLTAVIPEIRGLKDNFAQQYAFIRELDETSALVNESAIRTQAFLSDVLGQEFAFSTLGSIEFSLERYVSSAISMLDTYSANAAEAIQWLCEHCAYFNITANDASTFAAIARFADVAVVVKQLEVYCDAALCPISSGTRFWAATVQLRDTLAPKERGIIANLNDMTCLFMIAAQNLRFSPEHIDDVASYSEDVNQFFVQLSAFAEWMRQVKGGDDLLASTATSPVLGVQQMTRCIAQHMGYNEDVVNVVHANSVSQSVIQLAASVHAFGRDTFGFISKAAGLHVQHRIKVDLHNVVVVPTSVLVIKKNLTLILDAYRAGTLPEAWRLAAGGGVGAGASGGADAGAGGGVGAGASVLNDEGQAALIECVDGLYQTFQSVYVLLKNVNRRIDVALLQDRFNARTHDGNGIPVIERLFATVYDTTVGVPVIVQSTPATDVREASGAGAGGAGDVGGPGGDAGVPSGDAGVAGDESGNAEGQGGPQSALLLTPHVVISAQSSSVVSTTGVLLDRADALHTRMTGKKYLRT
ncbi:MAG: hypothetical protein LBR89_00810 [Holosporales bacterium]|jgi:hypothetical protein|nr:hypothetical protein [Holosporales bacterium]